MRSRLQVASLVVPVLLMKPVHAAAGVLDYLDQNGGCRVPIAQSFPREVMAGKPLAYGKSLARWTQQDLADFRSYFRACEGFIAATSGVHEMLLQRVDGYANRLAKQIARARAQEAGPPKDLPTHEGYQAQRSLSSPRPTTPTKTPSPVGSAADPTKFQVANIWDDYRRALIDSTLQNVPSSPDPRTVITHVDFLNDRLVQIQLRTADLPQLKRIADFYKYLEGIRPTIIATTRIRQPISDLHELAILTILGASNPLKRQDLESMLNAGIDLTAAVANLTQDESSWLVQMTGGETQVSSDNGIFCRVEKSDTSSIELLKRMMPLDALRFTGRLESDVIETEPTRIRFVFGPCKVSADTGSHGNAPSPVQEIAGEIAQRVTEELQSIPNSR